MKTKNRYLHPIDKQYIQKTVTKAPGHIIYTDKETGAKFDVTKAIDFLCKIGTPIRAALDGEIDYIVADCKENYSLKELSENMSFGQGEGNFIGIKHANGEFSLYSHLKYNSIHVKVGQRIKTGDVIAYSGNTGLSWGPHIHFMVSRFTKKVGAGEPFKSLEVMWKD